MKKLTATVAAVATVLSLAPAFAQDTINKRQSLDGAESRRGRLRRRLARRRPA
jgi:hypothetical protein